MKHIYIPIVIASIFLFTLPLYATSYAQPKKRTIFSPNAKHKMVVDPKTDTHHIYEVASGKQLWSFKHSVWHQPFMLANGGQTAVVLAWVHVQEHNDGKLQNAPCMFFYNKDGIFKKYSFQALCPKPAKTPAGGGPIGDFWRTWYHSLQQEDKHFKLTTTDTYTYEIETSTGKVLKQYKNKK